jgi:O-6-methylguanine DNA methyltransferase
MKTKQVKTFADRVRAVVRVIPSGRTMSYSEVARRAGSPLAARAVGNILHKNFDPKIPCHRVIRADGQIGGYNRGLRRKVALLQFEIKKSKIKLIKKQK